MPDTWSEMVENKRVSLANDRNPHQKKKAI